MYGHTIKKLSVERMSPTQLPKQPLLPLEYQGGINVQQTTHWLHIRRNNTAEAEADPWISGLTGRNGGDPRDYGQWKPKLSQASRWVLTGSEQFRSRYQLPWNVLCQQGKQQPEKHTHHMVLENMVPKPPYQDAWRVYKVGTQEQGEVVREHLVLLPRETEHSLKWF